MLYPLITVLVLSTLLGGTFAWAAWRWRSGTQALHDRLHAEPAPASRPTHYDAREIAALPAPVKRYFSAVLRDGQPLITAARLRSSGRFDMGSARPQWRPFTASQRVVTHRPGFDWDARIALAPGLPVFVHDAYVAGEGLLRAQVLGLASVAELGGTLEVARAELMRYLAEAAWYPTALLPSQGVRWSPIDDRSAHATLTDGTLSVTLEFRFGHDGLIHIVRAPARPRLVRGALVPTPWQGRFWGYRPHNGLWMPVHGEVGWEGPDGLRPYWRGRVESVEHEFARGAPAGIEAAPAWA